MQSDLDLDYLPTQQISPSLKKFQVDKKLTIME